MKHRTTLGFLKSEAPIQELTAMYVSKGCSAIAIVELCCSPNSCIRKACETSKILTLLGYLTRMNGSMVSYLLLKEL